MATTKQSIAAATHDELAAAYKDLIGYDPFEDNPHATDEDVREILTDWLDEEQT
jgi:hypothetical protein